MSISGTEVTGCCGYSGKLGRSTKFAAGVLMLMPKNTESHIYLRYGVAQMCEVPVSSSLCTKAAARYAVSTWTAPVTAFRRHSARKRELSRRRSAVVFL